ncbi:alpha-mannosidase [Microbacterium schleiferi]|uniref:Glycoside hydrolase family 38 C-terminal domain-containing protein n=1 Tax=Microbacterium schleiferi TaxID=69362 RepID=A0ABU7V4T7_9MICO
MHDDRARVEGRLARFVRERLEPSVYSELIDLTVEHAELAAEPISFADALQLEYSSTPRRWRWGRAWSTTWFRITGVVPDHWRNSEVELLCDLGFTADRPGFQVEGLAYRADGSIIKAVSPRSQYLPWDAATGRVEVYIEGAANPDVAGEYSFAPTPLGDPDTLPDDALYRLGTVAIAVRDSDAWELLQDVRMLDGIQRELPETAPRRQLILRGLERMLDVVDPDTVTRHTAEGRAILAPLLASPANASSHRVVAVGHAHIDSAWLWPVRETVRKVARTFSNVLDLMDQHPEFVFAASSAQQFAWLREHHPELFARVRERIAEGRFVPVGGMWVESDTNMPSGESMVRQFTFGKRFFRDNFDIETQEVWLPDSFGYSAALPQILAGTRNRWFLSQKLSWSQVNALPHHTFLWEGIDGTRVFTHLPPADTYISQLTPDELLHAERNFRDGGVARTSLVPFGWGDGGGGPTREMMAAADRAKDLEGVPRVAVGSPRAFFETAEEEYPYPPVWSGEMYLELHRGIYTSQLRTKQGNRRSEALLHEAELWATTATVRAGTEYPESELRQAWEAVLLAQFHDILPGSSIAWVHRDTERSYDKIRASLEAIIARSIASVAGKGHLQLVANARPHRGRGVAPFAIAPPEDCVGETRVYERDGGAALDNGLLRVVVDAHGRIVSLVRADDGREAIAPDGAGGRLTLHRDTPNEWDAWDIDEHYRRSARRLDEEAPSALTVDSRGVTIERVLGATRIVQRIRLDPEAEALDIDLQVDWQEKQKLLKMSFDLDVHADTTSSETQFGHVARATHTNTSWEAARFEFCAHRWVHVGEPGYGVAIANDSTYGHDAQTRPRAGGGRTTTVSLSVLRAPLFPDPRADQGTHTMRFSVRPGAGIREAAVEGYRLNVPLRTVAAERPVEPLMSIMSETVIVETIKLADDGLGDVILRCYESEGGRGRVSVEPNFTAIGWQRTDLLEAAEPGTPWIDGAADLELRPFEIVTLRFRPVNEDDHDTLSAAQPSGTTALGRPDGGPDS